MLSLSHSLLFSTFAAATALPQRPAFPGLGMPSFLGCFDPRVEVGERREGKPANDVIRRPPGDDLKEINRERGNKARELG